MKAKWKSPILIRYFREKEDWQKQWTNQWSSENFIINQEDTSELDNWIFNTVLDQKIVEVLSKLHKAPKAMQKNV